LDVRAGVLVAGSVTTTGDPPAGVGGTAVAALVTSPVRVGGGGDSATVVRGDGATVVGPALVVADAGVLRIVEVTGTDAVACKAAVGGFGPSVVVTGGSAAIEVTVGVLGGGGVSTGGVGGVARGVTVTGEACGGGAEARSGTRTGCGICLAGLGGLTVVVDGPVNGSASTGAVPPVSADNEIAVPDASTTTTPRQQHVRKAARIAPRLPHR
jgi:hypothetical protein